MGVHKQERTVEIAPGVFVGGANPCFVLAEAGINHNGEMENAKLLIDLAKLCGADAVKFQKRTVERILTKEGLEKPYDNENSFGKTYGEHKRFLEFNKQQFQELKNYADQQKILFTASGWDEESVDLLDEIGVPFFKVASADLTNFPLLEHTAKKGKPMIISTGMADMATVENSVKFLSQFTKDIVILHCTSVYPCKPHQLNLRVIETYLDKFGKDYVVGYSGHENGIALSMAAAVMGAKVIERHFTLDRTMKGGDHAASLEMGGLQRLCRDIHTFEGALGDGVKIMFPEEKPIFSKLAKSVVSAVAIPKGTVITREMLTTKGPGTGISPMYLEGCVGKKATKDLEADVVIYDADLA